MVFCSRLLAFFLVLPSFGYSDELVNEELNGAALGGLSENYRTRMNKDTEIFVRSCDNPSPPLSDLDKWCKIPTGWTSNPGDAQEGRTATEIWQPTGRCSKKHKFNALISQCVPVSKEACTWGQKFNSQEKTCESINTVQPLSPRCEIKGFNTEQNGSGSWLNKTISSSFKKIYAYVSCKSKDQTPFIPICNIKNLSNNTQTNWYKCAGPDPLNQESLWIEINIPEISRDEKDNLILFEIRGAYSKTPLIFHESNAKTFLYKI